MTTVPQRRLRRISSSSINENDPTERLLELVEGFQAFVNRSLRVEVRSVRYRLNLLWVHAASALLMAPLFAAIGRQGMFGPSFHYLRELPAMPGLLSAPLGLGGLVLGLGLVFGSRRAQIIGLSGLLTFYLGMAIGFAAASVRWAVNPAAPTAPPPAFYAPVLYLHMGVIMIVHTSTLIASRLRTVKGKT